jgi:hypothetical protein
VLVDGYVELRVYAELNDFLRPDLRGTTVRRAYRSHQTVKDVIEAVGIPHTEVDLVVVNGEPVDFSHRPASGDRLAVYPVFESLDVSPISGLRPAPLRDPRFVVDVNLGRLARLLRLLGFDVRFDPGLDDAALARVSREERRVLLTRDRGLLKRREVTHGLFVREDDPLDQAVAVVRRLQLDGQLAPFTRCLRCGGPLDEVDKDEILDRLLPLTRRHYDEFHRCRTCAQLYWRGSHHARLGQLVEQIRGRIAADAGERRARPSVG